MSMEMTWDRYLGPVIRIGGGAFLSNVQAEMDAVARSMQAFARTNHPWRNQTGMAEASFTVKVVDENTIEASHGVHYGKYLEYRWGGRFAVIPMTLDHGVKQIMDVIRRSWSGAWRSV